MVASALIRLAHNEAVMLLRNEYVEVAVTFILKYILPRYDTSLILYHQVAGPS